MKLQLFIVALISFNALPVVAQSAATGSDNCSAVETAQFKAGSKLGSALAENGAIFSCTVRNVGPLTNDGARTQTSDATRTRRVTVNVDEWLWNKPSHAASVLELEQTLTSAQRRLSSEGRSAWDDAEVQVGGKLIVALRRDEDGPAKYCFVVSDVNLFPAISITLTWHRQYLANSSLLVSAPELAKDRTNVFFLGYFVSYLWRGGSFGDRDNEATALGRLFVQSGSNANSSGFIRITLQRFVLSDSKPLSQSTQRAVTENLIAAASSDDLKLAQDAITILIRLAEQRKLEMALYLTPERSRKLSVNYRALVRAGAIEGDHKAFDSQLIHGANP